MGENFWDYFSAIAPSIGVGLVFWLAIRSIFRADRKERAAEAAARQEAAGRQGPQPGNGAGNTGPETPQG